MRLRARYCRGLVGLVLAAFLGVGCEAAPLTPSERGKQAVRYHRDGVAKATDGQIDEAIALLEKGRKLQPDHKLLRYDLGRLYLQRALKTDVKSLLAAQEASRLAAKSETANAEQKRFESRALNEAAWKDLGRAKVEFLFVEPYLVDRRPNLYYFLTQVYTGLNDYDQALTYLDKATDAAAAMGVRAFIPPERLRRMRKLLVDGRARQEQAKDNSTLDD